MARQQEVRAQQRQALAAESAAVSLYNLSATERVRLNQEQRDRWTTPMREKVYGTTGRLVP